MEKRRKDNLTDLIENLPDGDTSGGEKPSKDQLSTSDGELITLGNKPRSGKHGDIRKKTIELTPEQLTRIIRKEVEKALDEFAKMVIKKVGEKLAEKGFPSGK